MAKHQKHAKLNKPGFGNFHRNEWAILGTTCGNIQQLSFALAQQMGKQYKVGYVDADHKNADHEADHGRDPSNPLAHQITRNYTDKIGYHQYAFEGHQDVFQFRENFVDQDMVLVNGNHFPAKRQIIVVDPVKEKSLLKRLDQLSQVDLVLYKDENRTPFPFLKEKIAHFDKIPSYVITETDQIAQFLAGEMRKAQAPIYGLVLAGGKSQRMGQDKGLINYHEKPQREYVADQLQEFCEQVFISCRPDQEASIQTPYQSLADTFSGLGPFGGILSAFRAHPDAAWLVLACDLPLLSTATLQQLVENRNSSKLATTFNSPINEFPEPLITIWEPRAYPSLLQFLAQGYSCPRKVLINSEVELLDVIDPQTLMNVNHPAEMEAVMKDL